MLKCNKSAGIDGIPAEVYKCLNETFSQSMNDMFNFILCKGEYPEKWAEGLISPVFKSGETINPDNYRCITVQNTISKIMDTLYRLPKY